MDDFLDSAYQPRGRRSPSASPSSGGEPALGLRPAPDPAQPTATPSESVPAPVLDEDQAAVVGRRDWSELYLHAGPGSGKTTVVCALAARIAAEDADARVLILVFNTAARDTLARRLFRLCAPLIPKAGVRDPQTRGVAVLTFDEFGYQVTAAAAPQLSLDDFLDAGEPSAAPGARPPAADSGGAPGPSSGIGVGIGDYRRELDRACALSGASQAVRGWTHLVLDEAQDICPAHAAIIEAILGAGGDEGAPPRLFAAGDPRQEIYPGAVWFSRRLAAKPLARMTLRFNHRAAPELVAALNAYSRCAFPELHVDQVAARPAGGRVFVALSRDLAQCGLQVAEALAGVGPGESFAVAPVTLQKWGQGQATLAARQRLHELRPADGVAVLDETAPAAAEGSYQLATARKIKGQERRLVAVYGVGANYSNLVSRPLLAKLTFVAISRARDALCLAAPASPRANNSHSGRSAAMSLLGPVVALCGSAPAPPPTRRAAFKVLAHVPVADCEDGLSSLEGLRVSAAAAPRLPPLTAAFRNDPDFVGLYLEALLARALGSPAMRPGNTRFEPAKDQGDWGCFLAADGSWTIRASKATCKALVACALGAGAAGAAYFATAVRYTIQAGRAWTVSERLLAPSGARDLERDAGVLAEKILEAVGDGAAVHGATLSHRVGERARAARAGRGSGEPDGPPDELDGPDGSSDDAPEGAGSAGEPRDAGVRISYCPDIVFYCGAHGGRPPAPCPACDAMPAFELKHVGGGLTATHRRQAAVYAALLGRPACVLLNLADGAAESVAALPLASVELHARAVVGLRNAQSFRLWRADAGGRCVRFDSPSPVLVFVGARAGRDGAVEEVGAVAVAAGSCSLISAFCADGPGRPAASRFLEWVGSVSDACAFVCWDGEDASAPLRRPADHAVDPRQALRPLLRDRLSAGGEPCLAAAAKELGLPPSIAGAQPGLPRAFSDAILAMAVLVAAVDPDGAL